MKRKNNIFISKETLYELYINKKLPISQIEVILDVSRSRIEKLFIDYNIKKRSNSETQMLDSVRIKIKKTCLDKYGKENYFGSEECINNTKKIKKAKYGDENYCNDDKRKETNLQKYGSENYLGSSDCLDKTKKYFINNFGVDNVSKLDSTIEKIKNTKQERYGDENYNNLEKYNKTITDKYDVKNVSQLESIKIKKIETSRKNYGTDYPIQNDEIKEIICNTMLDKYGVKNALYLDKCRNNWKEHNVCNLGVEYPFQSLEIQKKCLQSLFKVKEYYFPSGRMTYVMGYEKFMIDILLNEGIDENDITTNKDCPIIDWIDGNGINRKHFPDIYIKSQNLLIEVKSKYTSSNRFIENILLKKKYAIKQGFNYKIIVINKKNKSIEYEID